MSYATECQGKRTWEYDHEAEQALATIRKKDKKHGYAMHVYKCSHCAHFHLGHKFWPNT